MGLSSAPADMGVLALERLLEGPQSWHALPRALATRWPDAPAGEIIFALIAAARTIEGHFLEGGPAHEGAVQGYRLAAVLGLDLYALQVVGVMAPRGQDLIDWWETEAGR